MIQFSRKHFLQMFLCAFYLAALSGCQKESLVFRINDTYAVYYSPKCQCNVMKSADTGPVLAEYVTYVMGNAAQFLVQTRHPRARSAQWMLLQPDQTFRTLPDDDAVDMALEMLKIDFTKDLGN